VTPTPSSELSRLAPAAGTGLTIAGLTVGAHLWAGGAIVGLAGWVVVLGVAVLAGTANAVGGGRPWSLTRSVVAASALQPLVHLALVAGADGHVHHSAAGSHHAPTMWVAHSVAAIITVVAVRWGVRTLRSLSALARQILIAMRGVSVPGPSLAGFRPGVLAPRCSDGVLVVGRGRGPPVRR
jgi:hypothetical protein